MKLSEKAALYRELAKLIGASFHLDRAVELLLGQNPSHARRIWLQGLRSGLKDGLSVAESVAKHNAALSDGLEITLISAGESSGRLSDALSHLARYFEAWDVGVRQMRSAIVYPLVLVHLGIVAPKLPGIVVADLNGGTSPLQHLIVTMVVFWGVLVLLVLLWRWLSRKATESAEIERWLWRIPLVGSVRRHWALARFAQVFHACLLAAMRMTECMRMAGEASHSGILRHAAEAAEPRIAAGDTVSSAMSDVHGFPLVFVHSIATAEESGTLDREMNSWAAAETIEAQDSLQRVTVWLPKIFYAGIVCFIVYQLFGMISSYFGQIQEVMDLNR